MRLKVLSQLLIPILFVIGCEKIESQEPFVEVVSYDAPSVYSHEVLERAYQMATMEWTPIRPIPMRTGGFYEPGETVYGVPYSSVKEINTYLFQDVSYHTFMTAVHNPYSVIYTENISEAPYHGANCAPYYGSVCSSSVMWAFGVSIPYYANQIVEQPFMIHLEHQVIDSLKVCDVMWRPGHVQMIYDMEYRADTLYRISMFEQSGRTAHLATYSKRSFLELWTKGPYEAYRYANLSYTERPEVFNAFPTIDFNEDLCPSKGDRAVYRTDEIIKIDIFNQNYSEIVLMNENKVVSSNVYYGNSYQYQDLVPGIYYVFLRVGDRESPTVSFEIVDVDVSFKMTGGRNNLIIYFDSSAIADYVALCKRNGSSIYYYISDNDRNRGYIIVPVWNSPEYYCKVVFKGEYGSAVSLPIKVR